MKNLLLLTAVLLSGVLILGGCSEAEDEPIETDTPIETGTAPIDAEQARDSVIDYLQSIDAEHAPADGLDWQETDLTPEMLLGATTKAYEAGDWTIGIHYPIVAPEYTVYTVTVNGGLTGWYWKGEVDGEGEITEEIAFTQISEEMSRGVAEDFLTSSPTYVYDGISETIVYVETIALKCPYCWQFVYTFESSQAGYGNRLNEMLAQVITSHEAVINVVQGAVTSATLDGTWDMLTQELIETGVTEEMVQYASVAAVLADSVYETTVSVEGEVSLLGELLCPCFELSSGGETIQIWYGLMVENDGTELPEVSVEGIENGDTIILTGVMKTAEGTHYSEGDFWTESIVKVN